MQAKISRRNKSRHANSTSNKSEIKKKNKMKKRYMEDKLQKQPPKNRAQQEAE